MKFISPSVPTFFFKERMERNCEVADLEKCHGTGGGGWVGPVVHNGPDVVIFLVLKVCGVKSTLL